MNKTFLFLALLTSLPAFSTNVEQNPFVSEHESVAQTANGVFAGLGACGLFAFGFFNQTNKRNAQNIFKTQKAYAAFKARLESGEFDDRWDLPYEERYSSAKGGKNNFTNTQWEKLKAAHKARRYERFRENIRNGRYDHWYGVPPWEFDGFTHEQQENLNNERQARENERNERRRKENEAQQQREYEAFGAGIDNGDYDSYDDLPDWMTGRYTYAQKANLKARFNARKAERERRYKGREDERERDRREQEARREREREEEEARRRKEYEDFANDLFGRRTNTGALGQEEINDWALFGFTPSKAEERPSKADLKKEWRKRQVTEHPDKFSNQGSEIFERQNERYKNLGSAYDRLSKLNLK